MRVIMFDRQSLFIHGAMYSLQKLIPKIEMTGLVRLMNYGRNYPRHPPLSS